MLASARPRLSFEEYCQIDADGPVKHEYLDGQAWAMAGGSREHAAICANVLGALVAQLRGGRCQAHTSDLRIRIQATGLATYPDVTVVCGQAQLDPEDRLGHTVVNPTLLVEVLSPSTEEYDRTEKLEHYKQIPSLREVVLIAQAQHRVHLWRRAGHGGSWACTEHLTGVVALESIAAQLPIDSIYLDALST
jgi:Uma2 family endonuclease